MSEDKEYTPPPQAHVVAVNCTVQPMKTSGGTDYYIHLRCGDRTITPNMFVEAWRAEYEVAEWKWFFGQSPKPDLLAYGPRSKSNKEMPNSAGSQIRTTQRCSMDAGSDDRTSPVAPPSTPSPAPKMLWEQDAANAEAGAKAVRDLLSGSPAPAEHVVGSKKAEYRWFSDLSFDELEIIVSLLSGDQVETLKNVLSRGWTATARKEIEAENAELSARLSRLLDTCHKLKWINVGVLATDHPDTKTALDELSVLLFHDGLATALASAEVEG